MSSVTGQLVDNITPSFQSIGVVSPRPVARHSTRAVSRSPASGRDLGAIDILSFDDADDPERVVEVKTTGLGKFFPFYVTGTEVRCSEDIPNQYRLFRVFDFGREPRLYILHGALRQLCQLDPVLYRAVI